MRMVLTLKKSSPNADGLWRFWFVGFPRWISKNWLRKVWITVPGVWPMGDHNRYLRTLCANHKIRMADYPKFHQYINYVLLADQIKSNELISEMDQLETAVQDSLAKTAEERTLMEVARDLAMVTKLLTTNWP